MKKILLVFTMLLTMVACTNKPATAVENNEESSEVVDKQYENKRVVLVNERETNYFPAIDRYPNRRILQKPFCLWQVNKHGCLQDKS